MSNCLCISSTDTATLRQPTSCIQHPLTKAALFVIAFLLAGAALASYFAALGIVAVVSFSLASLATFVTACVVTARCPVPPSIEELIRSLPSYDFLHSLPENTNRDVEDAYDEALSPCVQAIFGETIDEKAMQSLIDYAAHDQNKLFHLLGMIIDKSKGSFNEIVSMLERMQWPDEEIKKEILVKALAIQMISAFIIDTEEKEGPSSILMDVEKFFGRGDFYDNPKQISPLVSEALGYSIKMFFEIGDRTLKLANQEGKEYQDSSIKVELHIQQFKNCRFPASVITPALPYLKNLAWLTALSLFDIGTESGSGFQNADADLLLEILKTNPRLSKFEVNTESMSSEIRAEFEKDKEIILARRKLNI